MSTERTEQTGVLILGGGPGGYVAGIRAGQLGLDAVVVDPQPMGGTCLNVGCIPSKALIHAADEFAIAVQQATAAPLGISVGEPTVDLAKTMAWKDGIVGRLNQGVAGLLAKVGTRVIEGTGTVIDGKRVVVATADGDVTIRADHLVIATGSAPTALPHIPFGTDGGVDVISSTEALALTEVPDRLVVVGGGYIGLELGSAFAKLGSSVTVVEAEDDLLSIYDRELTRPVGRSLRSLDVEVLTATRATGVTADGLTVTTRDGAERTLAADKILVTVGRRPVLRGFGLEDLGLTMDGPFLAVDDQCRTSMRDVWAIGDVTGEPMLAHRAMKQGEVVAEAIAGRPAAFDPVAIPAIVFTDPEIVTVGLSPDEAAASADVHGDSTVGTFPLSANGRSMTLNADSGFVRVVARAEDHLVLGIQAVGQGVAELAAAFGLAVEMGARLEDIADTIHAHPTVGEGFAEAALIALGHPLHI